MICSRCISTYTENKILTSQAVKGIVSLVNGIYNKTNSKLKLKSIFLAMRVINIWKKKKKTN